MDSLANNRVTIRAAAKADIAAITAIYNYYILNTTITFELEPITEANMHDRWQKVQLKFPFLVLETANDIVGYAYATPWRDRAAYRYSCETTIYLENGCFGNGYGSKLYQALLNELRKRELKVAIGGIAQPNKASVALHQKLGYQKCAHFEKVGFKFNKWVDVEYYQLNL